jgi:NAD(P)-dependent dehydrogenase (short-subunit alcohol dehydrogenase family)
LRAGSADADARVVVNDLDPAAAATVASEIGGLPVAADIGTERAVADLIAAARGHLGAIDVYCSNAGTAAGTTRPWPTATAASPCIASARRG